jgi:hypothetical protein
MDLRPDDGGSEADVVTATGCIDRIDVLGVHVSTVDIPMAIGEIDRWVRQGCCRSYATLTGIHGIMESVRDDEV